jgi:ribonuclease VapC
MYVDASVILAIIYDEPDAERFARMLDAGGPHQTSPVSLFEAVAGLMQRRRIPLRVAQEQVRGMLVRSGIEVVPITSEIGDLALDAFDKYGKGRGHKAQLNMGDCFAYACAKSLGVPLLYKGDDFARTDLA